MSSGEFDSVVAVEPLEAMRSRLTRAVPGAEVRAVPPRRYQPARFGPVEAAEYYFDQELDTDAVVDMVSSRSYVIVLPEDERPG